MKRMSHKTDDINEKKGIIKITHRKSRVEKYSNWSENSLKGLNSILELTEESINWRLVNWDYPGWGTER